MARVIFASLAFYVFCLLLYFLVAGRIDLPLAWVYFLATAALGLGAVIIADLKSPGFARERLKPAPGERDRLFKPVGSICSFAVLILAGLDVGRFHWSPAAGSRTQLLALLFDLVGLLFVCWGMLENAYFSSAVRLQPDRGQVVVGSGPYAIVRHPGYAGGILYLALNGLALGSWWAGLAAIPMLFLTVRRTALEDKMLQSGLAGYAEYSRCVRYRLVPGIW